MDKKLTRSQNNRMICGVCAGVAEYLGVDVTVVRLIWALVAVFGVGTGAIAYFIAAIIIPQE